MNPSSAEVVLASLRGLQSKIGSLEAERDHYRQLHAIHQRTLEDQRLRTQSFLADERAIHGATERSMQADLARLTSEAETIRREVDAEGEGGLVRRMAEGRVEGLRKSSQRNEEVRLEVLALEAEGRKNEVLLQRLRHELSTETAWREEARVTGDELQVTLHRLAAVPQTSGIPSPTRRAYRPSPSRESSPQGWGRTPFVPNGVPNGTSFNVSSLRPRSQGLTTCVGVIRGYQQLSSLMGLLKEELALLRDRYAVASSEIAVTMDVAELRTLSDEMDLKVQQLRAVRDEMRVMRVTSPVRPVFSRNRSAERRAEELHSILRVMQHTRM